MPRGEPGIKTAYFGRESLKAEESSKFQTSPLTNNTEEQVSYTENDSYNRPNRSLMNDSQSCRREYKKDILVLPVNLFIVAGVMPITQTVSSPGLVFLK
ncbi:hypothetical protein K402DRAFT_59270 [Aulographum hederae CBS 113979]|uniref:Uncharacterized protein n=1 Tax=Aulographum hederae CBS 113979 TaxID=1176131 RepID=A0A6G1H1T2_9PEZI|nr:hypothetical protein K402DRAFT_59270 [Aulographum hederae CBS 113979]